MEGDKVCTAGLVDEIEENGFTVDLITVEVGARGFVSYKSFCQLNEVWYKPKGTI